MSNVHIAAVNKVSTLVQTKAMDKAFAIGVGGEHHKMAVKGLSPQQLSDQLLSLLKGEKVGNVFTPSMLALPFVQEDIRKYAKKIHLVYDQENYDLVFFCYTV